jgi:NAD(P)-dependent dehydrogenase (short-subunit alcohol dehydrogenase family)
VSRFLGKSALVTGAATGIGQAIAVRLASEGARVAVNHLPGQDWSETEAAIAAVGGTSRSYPVDLRDVVATRAMVDAVAADQGGIDFLVSNAGINPLLKWEDITDDVWDDIHNTILRACWALSHQAAQHMVTQERGGAIIAISSISARVGSAEQVAYCAAKAGVSALMMSLGCVLGEHGIRCNAVLPGPIETQMAQPLFDDPEILKYYVDRVPLHRIGQPSDIAGVVAFLCSDDAAYVNTTEILVDGGFIANAE